MKLRLYILFTPLLIVLFSSFQAKEIDFNQHDKRDTVSAMVSYGDAYLTRQAFDMDDRDISLLIDSLYALDDIPFETIDKLYFVYRIQNKSQARIEYALESLFNLDTIPYALINEINFHLQAISDNKLPIHFGTLPQDDSPFPANAFYNSWNTQQHNPYKYNLWKKDSFRKR